MTQPTQDPIGKCCKTCAGYVTASVDEQCRHDCHFDTPATKPLDELRRCPRCEQYLTLDNFGNKKRNKGGIQTYCKQCLRDWFKEHYAKNKEKILNKNSDYLRSDKGKDYARERQRRRLKSPEEVKKNNARQLLRYRVYRGDIERPLSCGQCEKTCTPQGHHTDYAKPLEVIWLCVSCHRALHESMKVSNK